MNENEKDYLVRVTVKNAHLLRKMRMCGFETAASLSLASGVGQYVIGQFLNLKKAPVLKNKSWSLPILKVAETLKCFPEDLFPRQHVERPLKKNYSEFEASIGELEAICSNLATDALPVDIARERRLIPQVLQEAMSNLTDRQRLVLDRRFGLSSGHEETLEEIGSDIGICRDRIRQIQDKALLRLKHPTRAGKLRDALEIIR